MARNRLLDLAGSRITATVGIGKDETSFALEVTLTGHFPTLSPEQAHQLMEAAHQVCPYSKAIRGNVPVTLLVA